MKRLPVIAWLAAAAALLLSPEARAQNRAAYEKTVAVHAKANGVPEALVHRVIVRESKYHPDLIGRGGTIGLMQIKLATARGVGYTGDAEGLRDPETNLTYGVKYLAGAYRAAEGNHDRAVHLFAAGYYDVAKRQRLARSRHPEEAVASAPPKEPEPAKEAAVEPKLAAPEAGCPERKRPWIPPCPPRPSRSQSKAEAGRQASRRRRCQAEDLPCREAKAASRPAGADAGPGKAQGGADALAAQARTEDVEEARRRQGAGSAATVRLAASGMAASPSSGANAAQPR